MKTFSKVLILILGITLFLTCKKNDPTGGDQEIPSSVKLLNTEELKIQEIEKDVFLVTHYFPWAANSLIVKTGNDNILWIDTPYTPEATAVVLDWISESFGSECAITEINTGFHIDNLGGNRELINRQIPVYGSDLTCLLLDTRSKKTMEDMVEMLKAPRYEEYRKVYSDFDFVKPTELFNINEEQNLSIGQEKVIIFFPGVTHTEDNLVVYLPGKRVLFGGCMIRPASAQKIGYAEDGDLNQWGDSLKKLEERFPDAQTIVPGHGDPGDAPELINHTKKIIAAELGEI